MVWSHNDSWLLSGDHGGVVKYWQSNMNNVQMYEAHKEPIRGLRLEKYAYIVKIHVMWVAWVAYAANASSFTTVVPKVWVTGSSSADNM
jgi:hypothetical protein